MVLFSRLLKFMGSSSRKKTQKGTQKPLPTTSSKQPCRQQSRSSSTKLTIPLLSPYSSNTVESISTWQLARYSQNSSLQQSHVLEQDQKDPFIGPLQPPANEISVPSILEELQFRPGYVAFAYMFFLCHPPTLPSIISKSSRVTYVFCFLVLALP